MITWEDLKNVKIPLFEFTAILAVAVTGFLWADDIEDKQQETQKQLSQLVEIVSKNVEDNAEIHKTQSESLSSIEKSLGLLALEVKLRVELAKEAEANPTE